MEKRLTMFLVSLLLCVGSALAQTKVSGTVLSQEDGQPIIGAAVKVVGTSTGLLTDLNGQFTLTLPAGKDQLEISYLGMESQTVKAKNNMRVFLKTDSKTIDEVLVIAYGTQKKSAFTGSASVVGADQIGKVQVTNAVDALKGKAAGIQINTTTGQPGSTPTIRIRGVNSINADSDPLIVLDGSPYDGSLNDINPTDVESMTVLKDAASTALYGARGGNGVILITTKSGKRGKEAAITVDVKLGSNQRATPDYEMISSPEKYYETWYKGLYNYAQNTWDYSDTQAWQWANNNLISGDYGLGYNVYTIPNGQTLIGTNGKLNTNATLGRTFTYAGKEYFITPDDWSDEIYNNSMRQEYTISATAANDRGSFYISANYLDNKGITEASDYSRLTARLKADYQMKKWLKIGANMSYGHYERNYLGNDGTAGSSGNAFAFMTIAPIYPMYIRDGQGQFIEDEKSGMILYDYGDKSINGLYRPYISQSNPISANRLDTQMREGNTFNGTGTIDIYLPYGFTFTSINNVYLHEYRYTNITNPYFGQYASSKGIATKEHVRNWSYNYQQRLNWHQQYGIHDIEVMLGHEYYRLHSYDLWASKNNMFSQRNKELAGAVVLTGGSSDTGDYNTESWLGRVQYNYDSKYFASFSAMREASSHFSKEDGKWWGTFWSVGGGWLINKEKFFKAKWVDELKLKASYGENGNDLIGSYRFVTTYDIKNSNDNVSLVPKNLGNADISWEKNGKFNIGFDFTLFKGRVNGSIEYYNNTTKDMLTWFPLPATTGYTGYYANVGNMKNNGIEFDLHGDIISTRDFVWSAYVNITSNHNEITSLPDARKSWYDNIQGYGYSSSSYFYKEGESRYTYYTKRYAGVYNESNFAQAGDEEFNKSKAGMAVYYTNKYEQQPSGKVDANGNDIMTDVYYDKNGNKIDNPDTYVGEKHRKVVGEGITTAYSEADDYLCGNVLPDAYGGFGTSVSWKGIDFSVDFQYQLGGQVYDSQYANMMRLTQNRGGALHVDMLNAYAADNKSSNIPRLVYGDSYANSTSDRFLTSASYLSLQNITLGYTLPKSLTTKLDLQRVRLYVVADNVWVWSKRQGLDPRQSITGSASNAYYSSIRAISGGISVTF